MREFYSACVVRQLERDACQPRLGSFATTTKTSGSGHLASAFCSFDRAHFAEILRALCLRSSALSLGSVRSVYRAMR